jgi:methyl-accepting chemotaxis protein
VGFLSVAVLCGAVGILGAIQLSGSQASIRTLATRTIPTITDLGTISYNVEIVLTSVARLANPLAAGDDALFKEQTDAIAAARALYGKAITDIEARPMTPEEALLWKAFKDALPAARDYNNELIALVTKVHDLKDGSTAPEAAAVPVAGQRGQAAAPATPKPPSAQAQREALYSQIFALMTGERSKAITNFLAASDKVKEYDQKHYATEMSNAALAASASSIVLMLVLALLSLSVATAIGIIFGNSISRSLRRTVDILGKIADGDLGETLEVRTKDEFATLAASLGTVASSLGALVSTADRLSEAVVVGRLTERADAAGLKGAYAALVGGVNSIVDGLVGFIDMVPTPTMIIDKDYQILFMNKAGAALGAANSEELVRTRRRCYDFFKTGDCRKEKCACTQAMRMKGAASSETTAIPADRAYEISYTGVPVYNRTGEVVGALEIVVDQTAIKVAERKAGKVAAFQSEEIAKLNKLLDGMAAGDLSVEYLVSDGDEDTRETKEKMDSLSTALNSSLDSINGILSQVSAAVDQVNAGSLQVSQASQALSQGATEQASSLEEITSSITEVSGQTRQNTENAVQVNGLASSAKENAEKGNLQMQDLVLAMNDINKSAEEISKIVKTIDDISFQINLLALNANVEAARAGKYGKGFAVVAEEVRNLAVRSADSVKETTRMVDEAIANITRGNSLVDVTAKQLASIVDGSAKVANLAEEVSTASREQALGLEQITTGLNQIDQVTQANTASAEESAAAAEELSSQAQQLRSMLARFRLKAVESKVSNAEVLQMLKAELARQAAAGRPTSLAPGNGGNGHSAQPVRAVKKAGAASPAELISLDDDNFGKF